MLTFIRDLVIDYFRLDIGTWMEVLRHILLYRPFLHYLAETRNDPPPNPCLFRCAMSCVKMSQFTIIRAYKMHRLETSEKDKFVRDFYMIIYTHWVEDPKPNPGVLRLEVSVLYLLSAATAPRLGALVEQCIVVRAYWNLEDPALGEPEPGGMGGQGDSCPHQGLPF
jgi:hypothetical protein